MHRTVFLIEDIHLYNIHILPQATRSFQESQTEVSIFWSANMFESSTKEQEPAGF